MKRNITQLRRLIRERAWISIPQLQQEQRISYTIAREIRDELVFRGWVEDTPVGVEYAVIPENLEMHLLTRQEVQQIYPQLDHDITCTMELLVEQPGADFAKIEKLVHGTEDTAKALKFLLDNRMVYAHRQAWFLRVTEDAVNLLCKLLSKKPGDLFRESTQEAMEQWHNWVVETLDEVYQNSQTV